MKPTIPNNAKILIRKQSDFEDREIAHETTNEITLKHIKYSHGATFLMSNNAEYMPIIVDNDHLAKITRQGNKSYFKFRKTCTT